MQLYSLGDTGPEVSEIRAKLTALGLLDGVEAIDPTVEVGSERWTSRESVYNEAVDLAVRTFQQQRGLLVDGIVGPSTYHALHGATFRLGARTLWYQLAAPMHGDDVATLQLRLQDLGFYHGMVDAYFGPITHDALVNYQTEYGLAADGICGTGTLRSLEFLGTRVTGGSPHALTQHENVRNSGPQLAGKRIVIDPGLGGLEPGLTLDGPDGPVTEAEITWDLAHRLEGRMSAAGMETMLTRGRRNNPTIAERAEAANAFGADLMVSLQCATATTPRPNGVATFHFGTLHGSHSMIGSILSDFVQREIVARTALRDCRSHGRTWEILRATRMPTVQIDVGYLTNESDAAVLTNPHNRDVISEAIVVAVKRLYLLDRDDQPTGTYTFSELLAAETSPRE